MTETASSRRFRWSGYSLGFALGGFFDGILLHQILQWHHLLSAINADDVRFQVAADGYFHALMYVIAAAGLWMLATSRGRSGRLLLANLLIGFGVWHMVDGVLSHWVLGIHRIRMDSDSRLFWDLLWLGVFGIVPAVAGWLLRRGGDGTDAFGKAAQITAALLVIGAGTQAAWPAEASGFRTVLFAPGTEPGRVFAAIASVDGQVVWTDGTGHLAVIRMGDGQSAWELFRHGAILVSGAGLPAGCFDYLRP